MINFDQNVFTDIQSRELETQSKGPEKNKKTILDLPVELIGKIFSYLSWNRLIKLRSLLSNEYSQIILEQTAFYRSQEIESFLLKISEKADINFLSNHFFTHFKMEIEELDNLQSMSMGIVDFGYKLVSERLIHLTKDQFQLIQTIQPPKRLEDVYEWVKPVILAEPNERIGEHINLCLNFACNSRPYHAHTLALTIEDIQSRNRTFELLQCDNRYLEAVKKWEESPPIPWTPLSTTK